MRNIEGSNHLTPRECRIVPLVAAGLQDRQIAAEIGTSYQCLKNSIKAIYDKLGFSNRIELTLWFVARESGK